jgi:hypothetical protein
LRRLGCAQPGGLMQLARTDGYGHPDWSSGIHAENAKTRP